MTELYFSRARLKTAKGEALGPLASALLRGAKGETAAQAHRIVWMLFGTGEEGQSIHDKDKNRLFLWRQNEPGQYYILSRIRPDNRHGLFDLDTQNFRPELTAGNILRFALRANPVVTRKGIKGGQDSKRDGKGRPRGTRCDIVMDALKPLEGFEQRRKRADLTDDQREEPSPRAAAREEVTQKVARDWLERQGREAGFRLVCKPEDDAGVYLKTDNYETMDIPRLKGWGRDKAARFGVLDLEGLIEITDANAFTGRWLNGFGKAKAFGCGLMLIRRA